MGNNKLLLEVLKEVKTIKDQTAELVEFKTETKKIMNDMNKFRDDITKKVICIEKSVLQVEKQTAYN